MLSRLEDYKVNFYCLVQKKNDCILLSQKLKSIKEHVQRAHEQRQFRGRLNMGGGVGRPGESNGGGGGQL